MKNADRTIELLNQLITQKQNLVTKLVEKGETASMTESFDSLVEKASGDTTPYFDGEIIIEKADLLLGLRRLKADYNVISDEILNSSSDTTTYVGTYCSVEIEPIPYVEGTMIVSISPVCKWGDVYVDGEPTVIYDACVVGVLVDGSLVYTRFEVTEQLLAIAFNIIGENTKVEEDGGLVWAINNWFLTNTEEVSV